MIVVLPSFFASIFGCNWSRDPSIYLGFPLGAKPNGVRIWEPLEASYKKNLQGWKGRHLSFGARLVLIKSILSSKPVHLFSLLKAPKGTINRLEQIQRQFLWQGTGIDFKSPLVRWEVCKASRNNGGLGIIDLASFNSALLAKWAWRFSADRDSWWKSLISIKYPNSLSSWQPGRIHGGYSKSVWSNICRDFDKFWKLACLDPGSGSDVSFWHDYWCPGSTLASRYPRVAAAALHPAARISDLHHCSGENVGWVIPLNCSLRGGAERERLELLNFLNSSAAGRISNGPGRLVWLPNPDSGFSVSSMYRTLVDDLFPGVANYPVASIWKAIIPTKVCFFLWTLSHLKLRTIDKLKSWGLNLANRCDLCKCQEETANHLFVDCAFVRDVWSGITRACPLVEPPRGDIVTVLQSWPSEVPDNVNSWFSFTALHSVCWHVWRERNRRIFNDCSSPARVVSKNACKEVIEWISAHNKVDRYICSQWLNERIQRI
ncbi:unnamed protein product [Linum tenue]|uniref:Reverse transcriptase zinc-binding domain-containing protein n=1 Tax=Linum tenue TaxID=586396 RepID=A0AAV0JI24_9ROSI|nr:unnamed protein product [Linum tenue]